MTVKRTMLAATFNSTKSRSRGSGGSARTDGNTSRSNWLWVSSSFSKGISPGGKSTLAAGPSVSPRTTPNTATELSKLSHSNSGHRRLLLVITPTRFLRSWPTSELISSNSEPNLCLNLLSVACAAAPIRQPSDPSARPSLTKRRKLCLFVRRSSFEVELCINANPEPTFADILFIFFLLFLALILARASRLFCLHKPAWTLCSKRLVQRSVENKVEAQLVEARARNLGAKIA